MNDKEKLELLLNVIEGSISVDEATETLKIEALRFSPEINFNA